MPTTNVTQIVLENDTARARRNDPITSHRAADRIYRNIGATKRAVLELIHQEGLLSGEQLNDVYSIRLSRGDWPAAKTDTPRKRAGELHTDGYLMNIAEFDDDCATYCLTEKGLAALGVNL